MSQHKITSYIRDEIKLDPERYEKLKQKYIEIKEYIESQNLGENFIIKHGSVATKTAIKPVEPDHEYDLDIAIVFNRELSTTEFQNLKFETFMALQKKYGARVTRKAKCINIKFTSEFNVDIVIMSNTPSGQSIFDEKNMKKINSDNLDWIEIVNLAFCERTDNCYRDTAMLLKFYWRQFDKTEGLIPSVGVNALVVSNLADQHLDYTECMLTTLSSVGRRLNLYKQSAIFPIKVIFEGGLIKTEIVNGLQVDNLIRVIDIIKANIQAGLLSRIAYKTYLPMSVIASSTINKPWMKK